MVVNYLKTVQDTAYNTAFLAAFNGDPLGAGTEVAGAGYERVAMTGKMNAATDGSGGDAGYAVKTNSAALQFPVATSGAYGTVTHLAVYTASTAGTLIDVVDVTDTPIVTSDILMVATGQLKFRARPV